MEISRNASRLIIFLFLAFNIVMFAIGFYMYTVYGLYRLLIVFSLLNILMFRLFTHKEVTKMMKTVPTNLYRAVVLFIFILFSFGVCYYDLRHLLPTLDCCPLLYSLIGLVSDLSYL